MKFMHTSFETLKHFETMVGDVLDTKQTLLESKKHPFYIVTEWEIFQRG